VVNRLPHPVTLLDNFAGGGVDEVVDTIQVQQGAFRPDPYKTLSRSWYTVRCGLLLILATFLGGRLEAQAKIDSSWLSSRRRKPTSWTVFLLPSLRLVWM
jgi:hypothetical protein